MPEVQMEVSGLSVVLKHCHKPQIIQPKATGFALRSLRIHLFPIESYSQRLLLRDERLPSSHSVMGCDWGDGTVKSKCWFFVAHTWAMKQLSWACAQLHLLMCAVLQTRGRHIDSYIKHFCFPWVMQICLQFQAFQSETVAQSGGVWSRALGELQVADSSSGLLMAAARACRFWE